MANQPDRVTRKNHPLWLVLPLLLVVAAAVLILRITTVTVLPAGSFSPADYGLADACQDLEGAGDAVGYGALYEVTQWSVLHGRRTWHVLPCCVLNTQDIPPGGQRPMVQRDRSFVGQRAGNAALFLRGRRSPIAD